MPIPFFLRTAMRRRLFAVSWLATFVVFIVPVSVFSQSSPAPPPPAIYNDKIVNYLNSNLGYQVGGGESTDAISEALRTSGAAFTEYDLGADYPEDGDRLWGTPIKMLSSVDDELVDSDPESKVLPGDVLQYNNAKFVYVTVKNRKTTTRTIQTPQHTSVVARVDRKSLFPTQVYEQNGPTDTNIQTREVTKADIGFGSLRSGWVLVFRPKPRVDKAGKYQISILNSTASTQPVSVKQGRKVIQNFNLNPANTESSYSVLWLNSDDPDNGFKLLLPNGRASAVVNASSYEVYRKNTGVIGVRGAHALIVIGPH